MKLGAITLHRAQHTPPRIGGKRRKVEVTAERSVARDMRYAPMKASAHTFHAPPSRFTTSKAMPAPELLSTVSIA